MAKTLRARGIRFLTVLVPTLLLLAALAGSAQAALLLIDSSGKLTGATGVTVGGATYNVSFVDGTCVNLFAGCDADTDFTFQTMVAARAAAQALLDQVLIDAGTLGDFDARPFDTNGCADLLECYVLVPYDVRTELPVPDVTGAAATNLSGAQIDGIFDTAFFLPTDDTSLAPELAYAVFTPASPVPEPSPFSG